MSKFFLLGKTLSHTFSPAYFRQLWDKQNIPNHSYQTLELPDLSTFRSWRATQTELGGLNVTIPYKTEIIPFLDDLSPAAREIQAVNTIVCQAGKLIGHNTDVIGFEKLLLLALSTKTFLPKQALIFGTGGSSKAVAYVLRKLNISFQFVSSQPNTAHLSYPAIDKALLQTHLLLINTTPLGMFPNTSSKVPLPYHFLTPEHICIDLVYNPTTTAFLAAAAEQGASTHNGLLMLHEQANAAWDLWKNAGNYKGRP